MPILVCGIAVLALLVCESRGLRRAEWVFKPLAAFAFIWAGLEWGALDSVYGQWILVGLVLCMVGDVLLIPPGQSPSFLMGMLAFLLGHLAYAIAFCQLAVNSSTLWPALLLSMVAGLLVCRWLWPRLDTVFKVAVVLYVLVILGMVSLSFAVMHFSVLIPLGATAFAVSDLAVARNRFVAPGFANRVWGLPLYFASQLVIAGSLLYPN